MVRYDENIIKRFAQNLYDQANLTVILFTASGVLLGGGGGSLVLEQVGMIVGAVIFGFIGYLIGQTRAFQLKLQAQVALCQVQIEQNTRSRQASGQAPQAVEEEYYSHNGVIVTDKRLVVPPHEWLIEQFQPVKVESARGKYRIDLLDKTGKQVHYLESDNQERIQLIAEAINKALQV